MELPFPLSQKAPYEGAEGKPPSGQDALAGRVDAMAERLGYLQEFSRRERNRHIPVDLNALLAAFYEDNRPDVELSGQTLRLDLPPARLTVLGDGVRLRRALENLCYNAVSFTPKDGGISLTLRREGADDGPGISPKDLPRVFDRGFSRRVGGGGDGLGLFIVRSVAAEHSGTVDAASPPGGWAVFTLRLPLLNP